MDVIYLTACLEVVIYIEDYRIRALLNENNKINVINKTVIKSLGLAMSPCQEISLIDANTREVSIEGIIENVPIFIRMVTVV